MKNRTKLPNIYLGVILCLIYLPIVLVVVYSFNESKISSVWGGFSLRRLQDFLSSCSSCSKTEPCSRRL